MKTHQRKYSFALAHFEVRIKPLGPYFHKPAFITSHAVYKKKTA